MTEQSRRTVLKTIGGTGAVGAIYVSTAGAQEEPDCDVELDALDFGEFCVGDEECAELDLSVGLGGLLPGFDDFELAEVDIVGDTGVFNVDADLENGELSLVAEFCPTFPGDFEATAVVTVEDPIGLLEATVCVDLFGTGIECEPNFEVKWLTPTTQ